LEVPLLGSTVIIVSTEQDCSRCGFIPSKL
jgi:hypothetical protein